MVRCTSCGQANRIPKAEAGTAVCGRCKASLPASSRPVVVADANLEAIARTNSSVVVDFWAPWCGPCRQIGPLIETLAAERTDVLFCKLNVDENQQSAARFKVSGIPTLIFLSGGTEAGRVVGAVGRTQIEKAIQQYLQGGAEAT